MPSHGIIYSAVGRSYNKEAISSARSVKKIHPKIKITIFTDNPSFVKASASGLFHQIKKIDIKPMKQKGYKTAPYAKIQKIKNMSTFPYDITLYLDCDTKIKGPIKELFKKHIVGKDMCIANSPHLDKSTRPFGLIKYRRHKAYNSGVIVYQKNDRTKELFRKWLKRAENDPNIYKSKSGKFYDQPKLVALLNRKENDIKLKVIPNTIFNVRHTMISKMVTDKIIQHAKIIHKH